MKKIVLLSTGGTIASNEDPTTGLMMAGEQTGEQLLAQCNQTYLRENQIHVDIRSVFQVPSNQMSFERCIELLELMHSIRKEISPDGYVVTHGTDTLEESAYFLSLYWDLEIPVVFTGAQFSPTTNNTDAFHNITNALLVAADERSINTGVTIAFNDRIFSAQYATKTHASNIDGFSSRKSGPLGIVDCGRVHYFSFPAHREVLGKPQLPLKEVAIIKSCMDMDTDVYNYYLQRGTSGLIIEAYGRGHVDLPSAEQIQKVVENGVPVVITSTCGDGEVAEVYGFKGALHDLVQHGAINGRDYDSKKARIKLMALLSSAVPTKDIQNHFNSY